MQPAIPDVEGLIFRTLLKSPVPVAIFSWRNEPSWPVEFVSPNVRHVLGYEAEDFLSGRVVYAQIVHPDDLARVADEVARHSVVDDVFEHADYRILDPEGRVRWVRDLTAVVRNADGRATHFLGYILESTAQHEALEAMAHAKQEAEAAARVKSEFLANVSHEVRTPLTLILGPLEALLAGEGGALPPDVTRRLERVQRNAERLYVLVNDLLDFSRLEAGRDEVLWEPVDVEALVSALVEEVSLVAESRGINLSADIHGPATRVPADRGKLEQIILNLLGNALKFTPAGGRVTVTVRVDDDATVLQVADTGPGIPAAEHERIFQRFEQVDASQTRRHGGTGLGLALVKKLTEAMGGTVSLSSDVGRGSCFTVRIPRSPDRLAPVLATEWRDRATLRRNRRARLHDVAPAEEAAVPPVKGGRPSVLLAEDSADMRAFMAEVLSGSYDVEAVADGAAALRAVRSHRPEVIVCDVMMPELDGLEVVRQLKADPELRAIPVILVTAKAGRHEVVGGLEAGADDYLPKPFDATELRARVHAAQRLHQAYRELEQKHQDLQAAHHELQQTQEQLVESGRLAAVGMVTAGISHELNNPIATILLTSEKLLRQAAPGTPLHRGLTVIERHTTRCRDVIRALLDYARNQPAHKERVPASRLVETVGTLATTHALGGGVRVECPPPPPNLPEVEVNVPEIEAALLNLLSNALDATPSGGRVSVQVRPRSYQGRPGVVLSVADTGSGIPAEVLPHIFDPFFTTKAGGRGAGLGLTLAQRMVRKAGGHIEVETAAGRGTTMRVWLPSGRAPVEQQAQAPGGAA
ncbi:MAG: ATP-binding protein [Myxococcota bacterium]